MSNSKLAGNVSPGTEPWAANVFTEQSAKGTFIRKNKELEKVLRKAGINTKETWDKIMADGGSIQDLPLDDYGYVNKKLVVLSEQDNLVLIPALRKTFSSSLFFLMNVPFALCSVKTLAAQGSIPGLTLPASLLLDTVGAIALR